MVSPPHNCRPQLNFNHCISVFNSHDVISLFKSNRSNCNSACFLVEEKVLMLCVSGGDDLAELSAGVGELLTGRGRDGKSGKVLMTD